MRSVQFPAVPGDANVWLGCLLYSLGVFLSKKCIIPPKGVCYEKAASSDVCWNLGFGWEMYLAQAPALKEHEKGNSVVLEFSVCARLFFATGICFSKRGMCFWKYTADRGKARVYNTVADVFPFLAWRKCVHH